MCNKKTDKDGKSSKAKLIQPKLGFGANIEEVQRLLNSVNGKIASSEEKFKKASNRLDELRINKLLILRDTPIECSKCKTTWAASEWSLEKTIAGQFLKSPCCGLDHKVDNQPEAVKTIIVKEGKSWPRMFKSVNSNIVDEAD